MNKYILKNIITSAKTILDIGSYDGKDARELSDLFECDVHCFEPVPYNFKHHEKLILYPVAIGNCKRKQKMYISAHAQSNSLNKPKNHLTVWPDISFEISETEIEVVSLDDWYKGGIVDLIWADVNGSERDLIKGGRNTLKSTRFLFIEVSDKKLYEKQSNINWVIDAAKTVGLELHSRYDEGENFMNILFENVELNKRIK